MSQQTTTYTEWSSPSPSIVGRPRANPFATPPLSIGPFSIGHVSQNSIRAGSLNGSSSSGIQSHHGKPNEWFRSRRTARRAPEDRREVAIDKRERLLWIIPFIGFLAGLAICGVLVHFGIHKDPYKYTLILDEDFSSGSLNPDIWTIEVQAGGFGNQEFEETTTSTENVFIQDGQLHLQPTLQNASLIENNSIVNLTALGTCTSDYWADCVSVTNTTNGTIVQPAKSARLNTRKGASIKYGRIEVTAKISKGDWLWPAIWLLPTDSVYGTWPASGEIDILESRGNNHTYSPGGNNIATSTLHYGPDPDHDAYITTTNEKAALHAEYGDKFHVYGLEWTPKYLFTYIDSRLLQVYYIPFTQPFWNRGHFPAATTNGTLLVDPWAESRDISAPFDEKFYLILNVAVGGRNGWFPDEKGNKPWVDASPTASHDFWNAQDQWYPTWAKSSAMVISRVQMWQQEGISL